MNNNVKFNLKRNLFLILPIINIAIWAFLAILKKLPLNSKGTFSCDFYTYYFFFQHWFENPSHIYVDSIFYYLPFVLIVFSITFGFLPYFFAFWLNMFLSFVFYALLIIEVNKLLKFANLDKTLHRFIILIISVNGWPIYINFYYNTFKALVAFVMIFILRREIQSNQENREKNLKYYLINDFLFLFILGISPYLFYFFIIYVFYKIPLKNVFNKKYIRRYALILIIFFAQNFLFIIYPILIEGFLAGIFFPMEIPYEPYFFYLFLPTFFTPIMKTTLTIIIFIFLLIMVLIFTFLPKLNLQKKISYYALFHLILSPFRTYFFLPMLIPLVMIIYIPFIKKEVKFYNFIKKNILFIIGISAIAFYLFYIDYFSGIFATSLILTFVMTIVLLHYFNRDLTREIFFG